MGQFYNIDVFQLNLRNVEKRFRGFLLDISVSSKCSYQKHTERKKKTKWDFLRCQSTQSKYKYQFSRRAFQL